MTTIAATSPSAFWFLTRGTGAISLVLLTLAISLGIANVRRTQLAGVPRFVFESVHRTASLLAVSFLLVHILTVLLDGFAPITLLDVVIPFRAAYRPLWVGFGAVAFDLMIAVTITSLVRRRIGYGGGARPTGSPMPAGRWRSCMVSGPARTRRPTGCSC